MYPCTHAQHRPGTYAVAHAWNPRTHGLRAHLARQYCHARELGSARSLLGHGSGMVTAPKACVLSGPVPVPTPPSIPASHQSYGFEEGADGALLMQPPPQEAAETTAAVGHLWSAKFKTSTQRGTMWSASRSARLMTDADAKLTKPTKPRPHTSPPQLQPAHQQSVRCSRLRLASDGKLVPCWLPWHGSISGCGSKCSSAAFASTVSRLQQAQSSLDSNGTPGPGAYSTDTGQPRSSCTTACAGGGFRTSYAHACGDISNSLDCVPQPFARASGRSSATAGAAAPLNTCVSSLGPPGVSACAVQREHQPTTNQQQATPL